MNNALFEVGETVRTCFSLSPNFDKVEIIDIEWAEDRCLVDQLQIEDQYTGWLYSLDDNTPDLIMEKYLRKLPPPADCSFNELIKELNEEKEIA